MASPVTTPARTILDLAALKHIRLERILDQAEILQVTDYAALDAVARAHRGHTGAKRLREALRTHLAGTTLTRSELEERFFKLCGDHGLPRPHVNDARRQGGRLPLRRAAAHRRDRQLGVPRHAPGVRARPRPRRAAPGPRLSHPPCHSPRPDDRPDERRSDHQDRASGMTEPERYSHKRPAARPRSAVAAHARMALRPLLRQLASSPDGVALARDGGRAFVSASLRPYLVAGLLDGVDDALASGRPALVVAGDDRQARDLAADLRHWLAPRPVRFYPSRGVAYESHLAPPPHLVGLRVAALDALLEHDTSAGDDPHSEPPVVVVSAVALSEKVPDPELRPHSFTLRKGALLDLDEVGADLVA